MELSVRSACVPKGGQTRSRARSASNRREPYNKNKNKSPRTHQQKKSPEMKTFRSFTMMREVIALGHHSPPSFSWWWGVVRVWGEWWVLVGVPKFGSSYPLPLTQTSFRPTTPLLSWSSSVRSHTHTVRAERGEGVGPMMGYRVGMGSWAKTNSNPGVRDVNAYTHRGAV